MPYKSEKIKIEKTKYDRRIKLTAQDKTNIRQRYFYAGVMALNHKLHSAVSQRSLAREYGVSRRLIIWTLYPERLKINKEQRQARGGSKQYYIKERNTSAVRDTRAYKQKLFVEKKIS